MSKYNICFCLDQNFVPSLKYVFTTFIKFNDPKIYNIHIIIYNIKNKNKIKEQLLKINPNLNIFLYDFIPDKELNIVYKYNELIKSKVDIQYQPTFINISNWSRFYISKILNVKYCLYLDLDILFSGSILHLVNDYPKDHILGAIPYKIKVKDRHGMQLEYLNKQTIKECDLNPIFLDNYAYNCGVIYYNLELWEKNNITSKIINIFEYLVFNKTPIFISGTEIIQNILIHTYKEYNSKYNYIFGKKYKLNNNFIIGHFKGIKNFWEKRIYLDNYNNIILK